MLNFIFVLIVSAFILTLLIVVHEFGHFIAAKRAGLKVEEFGIGYPPRIFGKKIGETIYSINLIPFGGFVKIYGENTSKELLKDKRSFCAQPPKTKTKIILAGVFANIILAVLLLYFFLFWTEFNSYQTLLFDYCFPFGEQEILPIVLLVSPNSPAEQSGIKPYDVILSLDGKKTTNVKDFISYVKEHSGKEVSILTENIVDNTKKEIKVIPRKEYPKDQGPLGVAVAGTIKVSYQSPTEKIFSGFLHGFNLIHYSFSALGYFIKQSFVQRTIEPLESSVAGFVGIIAMVKLTLQAGIWQLINLIALISLGLAMINVLPIPGADGGRMIFVIYEVIFKKPAPPRLEQKVNEFGFALIIVLLILITYKDILQFKNIIFP